MDAVQMLRQLRQKQGTSRKLNQKSIGRSYLTKVKTKSIIEDSLLLGGGRLEKEKQDDIS